VGQKSELNIILHLQKGISKSSFKSPYLF